MLRHILLTLTLVGAALYAGVALVPGEREQWTMLIRDNRFDEALELLERRHNAGRRDADAELALYKLLMSFARIERATEVIEEFAAGRTDDQAALAMLAKHHADTQNRPGEIDALERLFARAPSQQVAHSLLSYYRLDGAFGKEEVLLRTLLAKRMIAANDAERLGLMLLARGDLDGARTALIRFDEIANPERMIGRLALFDLFVQTGATKAALTRAAAWLPNWRKVSIHRPVDPEVPAARLIRMMLAADESEARRIICTAEAGESPPLMDARTLAAACPITEVNPNAGGSRTERSPTQSAMHTTGASVDERPADQ